MCMCAVLYVYVCYIMCMCAVCVCVCVLCVCMQVCMHVCVFSEGQYLLHSFPVNKAIIIDNVDLCGEVVIGCLTVHQLIKPERLIT